MKRWIVEVAVLLAAMFVAFASGVEVGHRRGYDFGWRDCKCDAKEQLGLDGTDAFWKWYDSRPVIRQKRSFWFP